MASPDSDPAPQVVRLTNEGSAPLQYMIDSDQSWLSVSPSNGSLPSGARAEIEVSTLRAGVWPDTHRGRLTIKPAGQSNQNPEEIAAVPVTFVVTPANGDPTSSPMPSVDEILNRASRVAGAAAGANLILFGTNLALGDGNAEGADTDSAMPLPTVLQGARVIVTDSVGIRRLAGLLQTTPGAISLVVPEGVSEGPANVTVRREGVASDPFTIEIRAVAPGLFSANLSGTGVAWGWALRVDGNGEVSLEPLADLNAPVESRAAVPIDLGAGRDDVFLGLVGTGIRGWRSEVNATVAGQDIHVDHAQAHSEWPGTGLDRSGAVAAQPDAKRRARGGPDRRWPPAELGYRRHSVAGLNDGGGERRSGTLRRTVSSRAMPGG